MAYLNVVGFETGDTSELDSSSGTVSVQSTVKRTGGYAFRSNPTTTAAGNGVIRKMTTDGSKTNLNASALWVGFGFRVDTLPASASEEFAKVTPSSGTHPRFRITSAGKIAVYGDTTLLATGTAVLTTGVWYWIEFRVNTTAGGTYEVRVDGPVDINGTYATGFGGGAGAATFTQMLVGKIINRNGNSVDFFYDDIAISDSAYPGTGEVRILKPNATGNYTAWTNGAGTAPTNVAEVPHDSDTGYITSSTSGQAETEALDSASTGGIVGTIQTVKSVVIVRDEAVGSSVSLRTRSSTTDQDLTGYPPGTTYFVLAKMNDTDPATGSAWTTGGLDSLEIGVLNNANVAVRCTAIFAMVFVTANSPQTPTPAVASLTAAAFAPSAVVNTAPVPSTLATVLTTFVPTILTPQNATPGTLATLLAAFAPSVTVGQIVTPDTASMVTALFAPTAINPMSVTPATLAAVLSAFAPVASVGQIVAPDAASLLLAAFAPLILLPNVVTPGTLAAVLTGYEPTVMFGTIYTPGPASLVLAGFAPSIFWAPLWELNNVRLFFPVYSKQIEFKSFRGTLELAAYTGVAPFKQYKKLADFPNYSRTLNTR